MKITNESSWDITSLFRQYELSVEIENIDKANKRKKQALRQQAKAINRLNKENQELRYINERLSRKLKAQGELIEQLLEDEEQRDDWAEIEREKEEWSD